MTVPHPIAHPNIEDHKCKVVCPVLLTTSRWQWRNSSILCMSLYNDTCVCVHVCLCKGLVACVERVSMYDQAEITNAGKGDFIYLCSLSQMFQEHVGEEKL